MMIFLDSDPLVPVQGMTGAEGRKCTCHVFSAGIRIVGRVNPRKAGTALIFEAEGYEPTAQRVRNGDAEVPVFGTVAEGMAATGANTTVIFVPPAFAKDAALEAVDAGIQMIAVIIEGIPVADATILVNRALEAGIRLIGPNCPGITSSGQSSVGVTPADITGPGCISLVSKSGTPTYQLMYELRDIGFTIRLRIGGDPVVGTTRIGALETFEADPDTEPVVMIDEIGGDAEERAAAWIAERMTKSVISHVAGFTAPEGKAMGHVGVTVSGFSETAAAKAEALEAIGVKAGRTPLQIAAPACQILQGREGSGNLGRPGLSAWDGLGLEAGAWESVGRAQVGR